MGPPSNSLYGYYVPLTIADSAKFLDRRPPTTIRPGLRGQGPCPHKLGDNVFCQVVPPGKVPPTQVRLRAHGLVQEGVGPLLL